MSSILRRIAALGKAFFSKPRELRYLIAGAWNTIFGYFVTAELYLWLSNVLHIVFIGIIANIMAITMSFLSYKLCVFRTEGNWLTEYLRAYVVYGAAAILGIVLLWALIDGLSLNIWIAQGISIPISVIFSYVAHNRFTFRKRSISGFVEARDE